MKNLISTLLRSNEENYEKPHHNDFLEVVKKNMKNISKDRQCSGRDSKQVPTGYNYTLLTS
jgi:hypothetical protein